MAKKVMKNKGGGLEGQESGKPVVAAASPPVASSATPKSKGGKAKSPAISSPPPRMEVDDDDLPDSPSESSSEADDSDVEENANGAAAEWPKGDDLELINRIRTACPKDDTMKYDSRVNHLDWEAIKFNDYSAEDCKARWNFVQSHVRHYRVLSEVLTDAMEWTNMPWYNFNKGGKNTMKHPDLPKKPLTSYMLFYMEQKDLVAQQNPGLVMTELSKHIAKLYNNLSEKKKQRYIHMAEEKKKEYNKEMDKFLKDHPDYVPPKSAGKFGGLCKPVPPRVPTPAKLYADHYMPKFMKDGLSGADARIRCSKAYRELPEKQKLKWINLAITAEIKYNEELDKFKQENPDMDLPKKVSLLTKEEVQIRERSQGKPEKPPNSGYSLFSKEMLSSEALKNFETKDRMTEISRMWKDLDEERKADYNERALLSNADYKMKYASYLSTLPEDLRRAELIGSATKGAKRPAAKASTEVAEKKAKTDESTGGEDEEDDDFEAPKKPAIQKPQNSLQSFLDMNLVKYQAKFPKMQHQELKRLMAKEFSKLTPEQKKKYDSMAQKSKSESSLAKSPPAKATLAKTAAASKPAPAAGSSKPGPASSKKAVALPPAKSNGSTAAKPTGKATKPSAAATLPDWAVKDWPLYPGEPPKPYEKVEEYHAAVSLKGRKPTEVEAQTMWSKLSKKERKKITEEHRKKTEEYSLVFETFVRTMTPPELMKYQTYMKKRHPTGEEEDDDEEEDEDEEEEDEESESSSDDDTPVKKVAAGTSSSEDEDDDEDDD